VPAKALFLAGELNDGFCLLFCDSVLFFDWDRINFLVIAYMVLYWICDGNIVDHAPIFKLLAEVLMQDQSLFSCCSASMELAQEAGRGQG